MKDIRVNSSKVNKLDVCMEVKLPSDADEWELYADLPGANGAAECLTHELYKALCGKGFGLNREDISRKMQFVMDGLSYYGAADTEPRSILNRILDDIFGEES